MTSCVVSSRYQIIIPKKMRTQMKLKPGQRLMIMAKGSVICMVPEVSMRELKGRLKGMDTTLDRDD